jgi:hypothetical protein
MSFPDPELRQLSPPVFDGQCVKCGSRAKQLPWQVSANGAWGPVCSKCGKTILVSLLRRQLRSPFLETELTDALSSVGLSTGESRMIAHDLEEEHVILKIQTGFCWCNEELVVESICSTQPRSVRKRKYHRLSGEEIFLRCVRLVRELLEEEKSC